MKNVNLFCLAVLLSFSVAHVKGAEVPRLVIDSGGHMGFIRDVAFTRDGRFLVSAGDDKVIRVWDKETGKTVRTIRGQIGEGDEGKIKALTLSPDNRYLAVGGYFPGSLEDRGAIRVYDFDSGELLGLLKGHKGAVLALAFSPDGRRLISGGDFDDKTVRIWGLEDPQHLRQLHLLIGHRDGIFSVAFSIDGDRVVSASRDTEMRLWDANTGGPAIKTISRAGRNGNQQVDAVKFSPDGRYLASGSRAGRVVLWDAHTGDFIKELGRHAGVVTRLSFSRESDRLFSAAENGGCFVFQLSPLSTIQFKHETSIGAAAFSPDGKTIVTAGGGTLGIFLRDAANGNPVKILTGEGQAIQSVGFARDGQSIAFGGMRDSRVHQSLKQSILLMEGSSYKVNLGGAVDDQTKYFRAVESVSGNTLKALQTDTMADNRVQYRWQLYLVRANRRRLLGSDISDYRHVSQTLTHDGRYAISGSERGHLTRYKTEKDGGEKGLEFVGHTNLIRSLAVSPDSKTLLSGSDDQTMKLWDIESGRNLLTVFVGDDGEWVAWTPEGYYASSLHGDKDIGWHINQGPDKTAKFYTAAQFQKDLYRPDVVAEYLSSRDIQVAVQRANDRRKGAGLNNNVLSAPDITALLPPTVTIISPAERASQVTEQNLMVRVEVQSATLPITNIKILLNGSPQGTFTGNSNRSTLELLVKLEPGPNTLAVIAFNKQSYSEPEIRKINYAPRRAAKQSDRDPGQEGSAQYLEALFRPSVEASSFTTSAQAKPPLVVMAVPRGKESTVEDANLMVDLTAVSFNSPLTEVKITVNGKPNASIRLRTDAVVQDVKLQVTLDPGPNDLSITASDRESTSEPQTRRVTCTNCNQAGKPDLIFLGIGISKYEKGAAGSDFENLSFADRDVREIAETFEAQNSLQPENTRVFNRVIPKVILNEEASKKAILDGLDWMNREAKKNSNNVHVVYLAGHGGIDSHEKYYFFSFNHSPKGHLDIDDVPWSEVMNSLIDPRGKAVVFVDTCHAGGTRKDTDLLTVYKTYNDPFTSVFTFIASDANGVSVENADWKHGAFTKAVLEGLGGAADIAVGGTKSGKIDADALALYLKRRVPQLASNQHPGYFNSTGFDSLVLFSNPTQR